MLHDKFYQQIEAGLTRRIDPELFERCAVDLLREIYPSIVPVRGGTDDGRDGEIHDCTRQSMVLVVTTQKNVLQNVKGSLASYLRNGHEARRVVIATTQILNGKRRNNIVKDANALGFEVAQIHDGADFSSRLYKNPSWCTELLRLTGRPAALTKFLETDRIQIDVPLVGRNDLFTSLKTDTGDTLLIGQPGSGKTAIFNRLVELGDAYFLVDTDREALADAIRELTPSMIIVDDAHANPDAIRLLRQLRSDLGATYRIVASTWPATFVASVTASFGATVPRTFPVNPLTRDEIVEVIEGTGIKFREEWIEEILNQSSGLPGLAITLCHLCRSGHSHKVADGTAILEQVYEICERMFHGQAEEASHQLAIFALGGRYGLELEKVAAADHCPVSSITSRLTRLAESGVISLRTTDATTLVVVQPAAFRDALIKNVFFGQRALPRNRYESISRIQSEVTRSLLCAARRGAKIERQTLIRRLKEFDCDENWQLFASLGAEEARLVLREFPEKLLAIHEECLWRCPEDVLPPLLQITLSCSKLNKFADAWQSIIRWVNSAKPGETAAVDRRCQVVIALLATESSRANADVVVRYLSSLIYPCYEENYVAPGSGNRFVTRSGMLRIEQIIELSRLWDPIFKWIKKVPTQPWKELIEVLNRWSFPHIKYTADDPVMMSSIIRGIATTMLSDVATLPIKNPAVTVTLIGFAESLGVTLSLDCDIEFQTLFPSTYIERCAGHKGIEWSEFHRMTVEKAQSLGRQWATRQPETIARRIIELRTFRSDINFHSSDLSTHICEAICSCGCDVIQWGQVFLEEGCQSDVVCVFAANAVVQRRNECEEFLRSLQSNDNFREWLIWCLLTLTSDFSELWDDLVSTLSDQDFEFIERCGYSKNTRLEHRLESLLQHNHLDVRLAAAVAVYERSDHSVPLSLLTQWKAAIAKLPKRRSGRWRIKEILEKHPDLALPFVEQNLEEHSYDEISPELLSAITCLSAESKMALIGKLTENSPRELVTAIVSNDVDCFRTLLRTQLSNRLRLAPLHIPIGLQWSAFAHTAAEEGYSFEDLERCIEYGFSYSDSETNAWTRELRATKDILPSVSHPIVIQLTRQIVEELERNCENARQRERFGSNPNLSY